MPFAKLSLSIRLPKIPKRKPIDTTGWKILNPQYQRSLFQRNHCRHEKEEYRLLKPSTINKYTYLDEGKRWLKKYDAIHFFVGYHKDRESALIEIFDAIYNFEEQTVVYSLGRIIEVSAKK